MGISQPGGTAGQGGWGGRSFVSFQHGERAAGPRCGQVANERSGEAAFLGEGEVSYVLEGLPQS